MKTNRKTIHEYTHDELVESLVAPEKPNFINGGGFPRTCPECKGELESNEDFDYNSEWTASYTCSKCGSKFAFQPTDMGQTLPWLIRYKDKEEVFKDYNWPAVMEMKKVNESNK